MDSSKSYHYDVALSYASEDRSYAEALADNLLNRGVHVFYDKYEKAFLWGKDLYTHLSDVYRNKATYCVIFSSQHYATKLWTKHELRAAQDRALQDNKEYILPIRLDNTEIPGILSTTAYLSWPPETAETITNAIMTKLGKISSSSKLKTKEQLLDEGNTYYRAKRYIEALAAFEQAITLDPNYALAHGSRGQVYLSLKLYTQAIDEFDQALKLDTALSWVIAEREKAADLFKAEGIRKTPSPSHNVTDESTINREPTVSTDNLTEERGFINLADYASPTLEQDAAFPQRKRGGAFFIDKEIKAALEHNIIQIIVEDEYPPFNPLEQIGASTINLRLGRVFRRYKPEVNTIDFNQVDQTETIELPLDGEFIIQPGEFIFGLTVERIRLPTNLSAFIAAKSSITRLGLSVVEQPFIPPDHTGSVALQLKNNTDRPIKIKPLIAICQVMVMQGTGFAEKPYGSPNKEKNHNETAIPQSSRIGEELNTSRQPEDITVDFALVTALAQQFDVVLKHLDTYQVVHFAHDPITYYRGRIKIPETNDYYEVVVAMLLGMGTRKAAISAMAVIERWRPSNVIMVGIAGGVPNKVTHGDVVVADFVFSYEIAKRTSQGIQRQGQHLYSDRFLYSRALSYDANDWKNKIKTKPPDRLHVDEDFPRVHFGAIASGEKILADDKTLVKLLKDAPELLAFTMESAGVAGAATHQSHPTRFLEIRGICDYVDEKKNAKWQAFAAEAAAVFTIELLRSRPVPPRVTMKS